MSAALASSAAATPRPPPAQRRSRRPWWPWTRRALTLAFFGAVVWLLVRQAQTIEWAEVRATVRAMPASVLLAAAALAGASHLLYATFDLLGRRVTGHGLPTPTVMAVTFVSYAFNLNMGSLIGGVASRYRLYSRLGLHPAQTTQITLFSMLTNWLGYLLLGGLALLFHSLPLPAGWRVPPEAWRAVGASLVLVALAYVGLCLFARQRSLQWRSHRMSLPSGRMALLQLAVSCLNWALIAGTIHVLMGQQCPTRPCSWCCWWRLSPAS